MKLVLSKGQKIDLTKSTNLKNLNIFVGWESGKEIEIDISAFVLNNLGKTESDLDFVYYNNANWGNGTVQLDTNISGLDKSKFEIDFGKMPNTVAKVALTATIYEFAKRNHNFGKVKKIYIKGINKSNNEELFSFLLEDSLTVETAIILGEVYKHNGEWKFNAVGSGYSGGLDSLCKDYGVTVEEIKEETKEEIKEVSPKAVVSVRDEKLADDMSKKANIGNELNNNKINLSKIELKKKGDKINLTKTEGNKLGKVIVNLNWTRGEKKTGLLGNIFGSQDIDLDLGCLFELKNGTIGCVQALGNVFGDYFSAPYINLLADDRTGDSKDGEFMWINADKVNEISRIIIYAFIYQGVSNWSQADAVIKITQNSGPEIVIKLDEPRNGNGMCGAVLIENIDNNFSIKKVEEYFTGHKELDKRFNWGLNWVKGSK